MIISNAPIGYTCPICLGIAHKETKETLIKSTDIVYSDDITIVFISSFFFSKNEGHVIIVPKQHFENIYDLPESVGHHIFDITKKCSQALKIAYNTDGITIKQNNEPAGDQHAFHYHVHVLPRYKNDNFNESQKRLATPAERKIYSNQLKPVLLNLI